MPTTLTNVAAKSAAGRSREPRRPAPVRWCSARSADSAQLIGGRGGSQRVPAQMARYALAAAVRAVNLG